MYDLAAADFGTRKHWHQRLPRVGQNTIHPIYDKVADIALQEDDIVYVDLGPVFGDMEADFGRTYVLGEPKIIWFPSGVASSAGALTRHTLLDATYFKAFDVQ